MFQHLNALISGGKGRTGGASGGGEILCRVLAPHSIERGDDIFGHLTGIEGIAPVLGDATQDFGLSGGAEDVAGLWGLAAGQIEIACGPLQGARIITPIKGDTCRDGYAFFGIADRRGKNRVQTHGADGVGQVAKRVDRAGYGHGMGAAQRYRLFTSVPQVGGIQRSRGAARSVQRVHLVAARRRIQHKAIPADPRHLRLANPQQHGTGNRGIHRVAAPLKNIDSGLCGQRMGRGTHAIARQNGGSSGKVKVAHVIGLRLLSSA